MEHVGEGVIADHLGISSARVRQLVRDGTIPKIGRAKYDLRAVIRAYCERLREQASKAGGRPPSDPSPEARSARERLTEAQARLAEVKADAAAGKLLPADDIERAWAGILRDLRSALLAIPSRVGATLPHLTAHDVATLDRELKAALAALADDG